MSGGPHDGSADTAPHAGAPDHAAPTEQDAPFRKTLARVLLVQVVALILLWLLQATYHG